MAKRRSYSVAPGDSARQSIFTRAALVGVVGVALVGLVLVFPKEDLLSRLKTDNEKGDRELTITYLRNIIRTEQRDIGLRFLLVDKLIAAREFVEAAKVLNEAKALATKEEDLAKWSKLDADLAWTIFRVAREKAASNPQADSMALEALRMGIEQRLGQNLAKANTPEGVWAILMQANDIGAKALVRSVLQRVGQIPKSTFADLLRAGKEALALGYFEDSAKLYFAAKTRTTDLEARRNTVMLGVKALLASGAPKEAYAAALKELDKVDSGDAFNWTLVDLALASGDPKAALGHLRAVVPPSWDAATLAKKLDNAQLLKALDVALAGGDLPEALLLAQAGLIQNPGQSALREKFAQMAEWAGKPQEALQAWLALMGQNASDKAIANVLRLSPMLFDDDALIAAWLATNGRRALSLDEVKRIIDIYERLGQPRQALLFLERIMTDTRRHLAENTQNAAQNYQLRAMQGQLLERSGASALAIAALEALRQSAGKLERPEAMRLAGLHLKAGQQAAALQALLAYTPARGLKGQAFDQIYWDLRADLAFETGRVDLYVPALLAMWEASTGVLLLKSYQVERLVRHYVDIEDYAQAIVLAKQIYPRLALGTATSAGLAESGLPAGLDEVAFAWLDALSQIPTKLGLSELMAALTPEHRIRLLKNPDVLARRANIYAGFGEKTLAANDYRSSLTLRNHAPTRLSYWWLLIDMADAKTLRTELAAGGAAARADPLFLEVQGAAWQILGDPRKALQFYRRQAAGKAADYLWLANYADVLESAGDAALALRVRRHAFALLGSALAKFDSIRSKEAAQAVLVRLRLSENFASGDEKQRLAKLLGQVLSGESLPPDLRKQADDLIVSWALGATSGSGTGGGREETARRWLWQKHAAKVGGTEYGEMALALSEGNVQALDRLMEKSAKNFQQLDQLNALRQLAEKQPGRRAQAATLATELAQRDPEMQRSDELQEALENDLLKLASRASISPVYRKLDGLTQAGVQLQADIAITPRLRLSAELKNMGQTANNPVSLAAVPAHDSELALAAKLLIDGGSISGAVTQRSGFAQVGGVALKLARSLGARLGLEASVEKNQRSDGSTPLAVAGMQDKAALNLSYAVSKDLTMGAGVAHTRYRTQTGAYLGKSSSISANASYFLRRDYPDWTAQIGWRKTAAQADGKPDAAMASLVPGNTIPNASFFVAPSSSAVDISIGWGMSQAIDAPGVYSRALRPWAQLGLERRETAGQGVQTSTLLRLGLRGSVAGRDQLAAGIELRPTPGGSTAKEMRLQYEWIGDK